MASEFPELVFQVGANVDGFKQAFSDLSDSTFAVLADLNPHIAGFAESIDHLSKEFLSDNIAGFGQSLTEIGPKAEEVSAAVKDIGGGAAEAQPHVEALRSSLTEMAGAFGLALGGEQIVEMFRDLVKESVEAFGKIEMVTSGLTALTGSAEEAEKILSAMKDIAASSIFSFPDLAQAAQKMAALGVSAAAIPGAIKAVADAAMVTGNSFDAVSGALDRIYLSGDVSKKSLNQLAISLKDLSDTTGIATDHIAEAFKALGPESEDALQIVVATVERKTGAAAAAMHGISLAINQVKVEWDSLLESFGGEIAPNVKELAAALRDILPTVAGVAAALAKVASSQLTEAVEAWASLGNSVKLVAAQFGELKIPTFGAAVGDIVNYVSHLDELKLLIQGLHDGIEGAIALTGIATGKYSDFASAINALDTQTTKLSVTQKDNSEELDAATGAAVAAALAVEALKEKQKDLDDITKLIAANLSAHYVPVLLDLNAATLAATTAADEHTAALRNAETARDQLAVAISKYGPASLEAAKADAAVLEAERQLNDTTVTLKESTENLVATRKVSKDLAELLASADKVYADSLRSGTIPTLQSLSSLEVSLRDLYQNKLEQEAELQTSRQALLALDAEGIKAGPERVAAENDLKAARDRLLETDKQIAATTGQINTVRKELSTSTKELQQDERELDKIYQDIGGHIHPVAAELEAFTAARQDAIAKANELRVAEQELSVAQQPGTNQQDLLDATARATAARDAARTADEKLSEAERNLQRDYGVSAAAARLLTDKTDEYRLSGQQLADSLKVSGQQSIEALQKQADASRAAYEAIAESATTSAEQSNRAWLKHYEDLVSVAIASGTSISAADQIEYASRAQAEKDYIADSITRWSDYQKSVHDDTANLFSGLTKDLFEGGDFEATFKTFAQKIGEDTVGAILQPLEHAAEQWVSKTLTDLLTSGFGDIFSSFTSAGSSAGLGAAAGTLQAGATTLQTAAATLQAAAASLQGAVGTNAAGAAGGIGGGGGGEAISTLSSGIAAWVTAAATVAVAIEGFFQIAEESNMKQSLNGIHNDTTMMNWHISNAGGVFDTSAWTADHTLNILDQFGGFREDFINMGDWWEGATVHLGSIRWDLLPSIVFGVQSIATSLTNLPQAESQATMQALAAIPAPIINLKVQAVFDTGQVADALAVYVQQQGVH